MLYFAYGANLNRRALKRTAPRAQPVSIAKLPGYRLVFRRYCDIAPDPKSFVWGALYELTPACERALDAFEQVPTHYRKITVTVETDLGAHEAMAYVAQATDIAPPEIAYYTMVARGYADWGLDQEQLRRARYATIKPGLGGA